MYTPIFDLGFGKLLRESCFGSLNKDVNQNQMLYLYPFSLGTWYIIQIEKKHDTYREEYLGLRGSRAEFGLGIVFVQSSWMEKLYPKHSGQK